MFEEAGRLFRDGGPIMYPLLLCSLVGLTVIIERSLFHLRRKNQTDRSTLIEVLDRIRKGEWEAASAKASGSRDPLLQAVSEALSENGAGEGRFLEMVYAEEERHLSRFMPVMDTIITLSPLLGILGTVLGIIDSFDLLGARGARDPMAVTGGIARALITTATGLSIAIITLIPFNFFRSRVEASLSEIEEVSAFLDTYKEQHHS